jgi:hypothetical protein
MTGMARGKHDVTGAPARLELPRLPPLCALPQDRYVIPVRLGVTKVGP